MKEIKIGAIYNFNGIPVKALDSLTVCEANKYSTIPVVDCLGHITSVCVGSLKSASTKEIKTFINVVRKTRGI